MIIRMNFAVSLVATVASSLSMSKLDRFGVAFKASLVLLLLATVGDLNDGLAIGLLSRRTIGSPFPFADFLVQPSQLNFELLGQFKVRLGHPVQCRHDVGQLFSLLIKCFQETSPSPAPLAGFEPAAFQPTCRIGGCSNAELQRCWIDWDHSRSSTVGWNRTNVLLVGSEVR